MQTYSAPQLSVSPSGTLHRLKSLAWPGLLMLLLSIYILLHTRISGDGGEYVLMSHALFKHGSAILRPDDVKAYLGLPLAEVMRVGVPDHVFQLLLQQMQSSKPDIVAGFFPDAGGRFMAIHFWMYSLLAVPYYALLSMLGVSPVLAFGMLNLSFAGGALYYLCRAMPRHAGLAGTAFLLTGSSFYLSATGPEVMAASCVLIACIAMLRGELGLACLMAGLGASQNPPLLLLLPAALAVRLLLAKRPDLAWPDCRLRPWNAYDLAGMAAGAALALLPFAFFQAEFGVPSLIAKYFTSPDLITPNRLFSLLFDLNQGMVVGMPALLAALLLPPFLLDADRRGRWLPAAGLLCAVVLGMALPSLSATNWNSGSVVTSRYAYWLGMPLLVLACLAALQLPAARARWLFGLMLALQALVLAANGELGERYSYLNHTPLARLALNHTPSWYNPDAEVFFERGVENEQSMSATLTHVYRRGGAPLKLLRHESNTDDPAGLCPAGQLLQGSRIRRVDGGWQYVHAPFTCHPAQDNINAGVWRVRPDMPNLSTLLAGGWSQPEARGVWSEGAESTLLLPLPAGRQVRHLRINGLYYNGMRTSSVSLNGKDIGQIALDNALIDLPADARPATVLSIGLRHPQATSPKALGQSDDGRVLAFQLQGITLE
ncbi:hypothetical protein [Rugamonas rubra]|nr:hypothetical protein [Rugamonas rubra]